MAFALKKPLRSSPIHCLYWLTLPNDETRHAAIGFDLAGRLLYVVHIEIEESYIRIISARRAEPKEEFDYVSDRLKKRLKNDRPMTSITLRIPVDVVESMKEIAPHKGFSGYQTLLKSYISEGLRKDEGRYSGMSTARLIEALKKHGVSEAVIEEATRDLTESTM